MSVVQIQQRIRVSGSSIARSGADEMGFKLWLVQ
jgi:hypothetical protein